MELIYSVETKRMGYKSSPARHLAAQKLKGKCRMFRIFCLRSVVLKTAFPSTHPGLYFFLLKLVLQKKILYFSQLSFYSALWSTLVCVALYAPSVVFLFSFLTLTFMEVEITSNAAIKLR